MSEIDLRIIIDHRMITKWQCLLTLTSGGSKSHHYTIDTNQVEITVKKVLLTHDQSCIHNNKETHLLHTSGIII